MFELGGQFVQHVAPVSAERSSSGLVEFRSTEEAVEALVVSNHRSIPRSSEWHSHPPPDLRPSLPGGLFTEMLHW